MITAPDDLKIGMWVAIVQIKEQEQEEPSFFMPVPRRRTRYDGTPLKIVAISLPFASVVNSQGMVASIDLREVDLRRLTPHYVRVMTTNVVERREKKRKRRNEKPDTHQCPRCHARCIERLIVEAGKPNRWILVCPQCGLTGDPAPL